MQHRYSIFHVYEISHFPHWCTGLFKTYEDIWLKLKEEASGWPDGCTTLEQWQARIDVYQARERNTLNPAYITKNPEEHAFARLMLKLMWGKFGQRLNETQIREFTKLQPFLQFLDSDQYDLWQVIALTEDRVEAHYNLVTNNVLPSAMMNVFVATFTTYHAPLRLYQALHHLQECVLYFDTDSVI